jgi:guanylate kinase
MTACAIGQLFIVAAPSGGGKTSLVQSLVKALPQLKISVSHTTRDQRPGEIEGEHYFFVSEAKFMQMVAAGEFVEHASVYGHHYGTSQAQLENSLKKGIDVVLDIDWQGAEQLRERFVHAVSIFILPPSLDILRQRLKERARDHGEVIRERMEKAKDEIQHFAEFDYLIVNEVFLTALDELKTIVLASRLKASIQTSRHHDLLSLLIRSE